MNKKLSINYLIIAGIICILYDVVSWATIFFSKPLEMRSACIVRKNDHSQCMTNYHELLGQRTITVCGETVGRQEDRVRFIIVDEAGKYEGNADTTVKIRPGAFCADLQIDELLTFKKYRLKAVDQHDDIFKMDFEIK